jgi:aryl-alcohol dehydrogenase-like predicted oxidoreductase
MMVIFAKNPDRISATIDPVAVQTLCARPGCRRNECNGRICRDLRRRRRRLSAPTGQDEAAYVPFFPLGGFTPLQSSTLSDVAGRLGATPMQVAVAWLLQRSPKILLIPGTSSLAHLRENLAAGRLTLSPPILEELDGLAAAAAEH